jgi:hypothetical protein
VFVIGDRNEALAKAKELWQQHGNGRTGHILDGWLRLVASQTKRLPLPEALIPDPQIQQRLTVIQAAQDLTAYHRGLEDLLSTLERHGGKHAYRPLLVMQLLAFLAQQPRAEASFWFVHVIDDLQVDPTVLISTVAPYFAADDPKFRAAAESAIQLGGVFELSDIYGSMPTFGYVSGYLVENPPPALIALMYNKHPSAAFFTMLMVYLPDDAVPERTQLLEAEHQVAEHLWARSRGIRRYSEPADPACVVAMDHLVRSKRWWARLFAVELSDRFASLRQTEPLKALADDENELVKRRAIEVLHRHQASPTTSAGKG